MSNQQVSPALWIWHSHSSVFSLSLCLICVCVCGCDRYPIWTLHWILCIVHKYLSAITNRPDALSSLCAPPLLHPSLELSCAHTLALTLIDTEKRTDEVKWNEKWEDEMERRIACTHSHTVSVENTIVAASTANSNDLISPAHSACSSSPWQRHSFPFPQIFLHRLNHFTLPKASFKQGTQFIVVSLKPDLPLFCSYNIFFRIFIHCVQVKACIE